MTKLSYIAIAIVILVGAGYAVMSNSAPNELEKTENPLSPPPTVSSRITDVGNLYSVELPSGWISSQEGKAGVRLSALQSQSPDFKVTSVDSDGPSGSITYETGAILNISVTSEEPTQPYHSDSATISRTEMSAGGETALVHSFTEPSLGKGVLLDAHFAHESRYYLIWFAYNPSTFASGDDLFSTDIVLNKIPIIGTQNYT